MLGYGRSNIEEVLGWGQTLGPRCKTRERPLVMFLRGGSESRDKGKAAGKGLAEGDDVPVIELVAGSWSVWRGELSGLSTSSRKTLSSCKVIDSISIHELRKL